MLNTTARKLVTGLVLSGLVCAAPALAQSALAQQNTAQQGSKSSTTSSPTAKSSPSTAKSAAPKSTASNSTSSKPTTTAKKSPPKPLVYVEDNRSVKPADAGASKTGDASTSKNASGSTGKATNVSAKKASDSSTAPKPLSADVTKAFVQNCPSVALTASKYKAAYDVTLERDPSSKGVKSAFGLHKNSKIEVIKGGKELFSESGHSTGQLVKDACTSMGTPGVKVAKN
jgi:hypothetical protein